MKRTILSVFVLVAVLSSCKIFEKTHREKQTPAQQTETTATQPKVFSADNTSATSTESENSASGQTYSTSYSKPDSKPISMRKENFTFSQQSDMASYGNKNFFVIVGSFGNYDNATRLKANLQGKGFSPIILKSESGYYRVCINSYTDEADARARVSEIRAKYSDFKDCWLLIKN